MGTLQLLCCTMSIKKMKCSTINPFPFLGMAFQNLKSRLGCNWVYDTYGYLILRHMGFGLHGLVIVLQKLPWIGTCCLLWWSAQGHGQFSMRSCIASITNVAKCQNPAGSWWSLGGIWSTWLPFFLTLRLLSHPDCASMIMNYVLI